MATIKISKYLSEAGIASRRKAETLVTQGLVFVNSEKMDNVAKRIDPTKDKIEFQGKAVALPKSVYYLLNKPVGYTSTTEDKHAKKPITELAPKSPKVWPVGRLDLYTTGLILLTNDGDLTQKLTHPRYEIEKEYEITSNQPLDKNEIAMIQRGVKLEDGFIKPDRFETIGTNLYRITLHSGKKRVVRRIIEKIGKSVAKLKRTRIGFLVLGNLKPGQWRPLTQKEIEKLTAKKI
jgi:23S rRNA pseudouridine2605 synthase